jgi:Vacuolar protein sorting-associated protein 62
MTVVPILVLDSREQWKPVPVEESLAVFDYHWDKASWCLGNNEVSKLNFPPDMAPAFFTDMPAVMYYRIVKGNPLIWHQYWTWWTYNPKEYAGKGEHEGDWEMVQLGCKDENGDEPVLMTCSQHGGGERRHYWDVELSEGKSGQPLVYVALDSHANYFAPVRTVTDIANGKGERLEPEIRKFGPWTQWMGRWGNSANSPGPLSTRRYWRAPHAWHSQARG